MHLLRTTRRAGYLFAAGAATAYLLDPETGPARRAQVVDRLRALVPERDELADLASEAPSAPVRSFATASPTTPRATDRPEGAIHIDAERLTDGSGEAFPKRMESSDLHDAELDDAEIH